MNMLLKKYMKFYITDGTPAAFFTAVFNAFNEKELIITSDDNVQLSLGSEVIRVDSDMQKCERVRCGIAKYDKYAEEEILLALRSCDSLKEQIAFEYIRKLMSLKAPIRKMLSLTETIEFNDLVHKVTGEAHKLKGFLRFIEGNDGALYAPYSPDNNITDLLM